MDQGVVPVIGYHPRVPFSESNFQKLKEVPSFPGVAGLGEIGIERTEAPENWTDQTFMVMRLLDLLSPDPVLVLHCRGLNNTDEAALAMLHLLMVQ